MIVFTLFLLSFQAASVDGGITAQLDAATAAMVVEWEDTRRPVERYRFYRSRTAPESDQVSWTVTSNVHTVDRGEVILTSGQCPELSPHMARLENLQVGPVISPPSSVPPASRLGPALYTLWGRNRSADGLSQTVMVRDQEGPVGDWGRDTLAIIAKCTTAKSGVLTSYGSSADDR